MSKLTTDLLAYLKAVFVETWQKLFTLFDILGIVLLIYPELAKGLANNESLIRIIGGCIFFLSFLLANFSLYRKLAEDNSYNANIHLEVLQKEFSHSYGSRPFVFQEIQSNPGGFNKQGLPDWGELWAEIRVANVGYEDGQLVWEFDEAKIKLPTLFDSDKISIDFSPPVNISNRKSYEVNLFFDVLLTERDPHAFAQALRSLVKSKRQYQIVLQYRTHRVDGESETRKLIIKGDFRGFYEKILKHWNENGFKELADLAQVA
jgi:hypothetical protein